MASPYEDLEPRAFWRTGVTERPPLTPGDVYRPRFAVSRSHRIATAGSCFAQHVGRTLKTAGYNVLDLEPLPDSLHGSASADLAQAHGFGLYSARYGNVYTVRQLLQLFQEALGRFTPAEPIWTKDGRFYDALRPGIEPGGFASAEEVRQHRLWHLKAVAEMLAQVEILVFTFGLTEAWVSREDGTVYPTAPGTIAGSHDPARHAFHNFSYPEVMNDFLKVRQIVMSFNPRAKFIVTVSPVPLTATASDQHVEVATTYSKAVLRAVCGALDDRFKNVAYFPSFEVITSQTARGAYYEGNLRNVNRRGVETAMGLFMAAHAEAPATAKPERPPKPGRNEKRAGKRRGERKQEGALADTEEEDGIVCEEALLEAFSR